VLGRVLIFQPALPEYRLEFFDRVYREIGVSMEVFYPPSEMGILTTWTGDHAWQRPVGSIKGPFAGFVWQSGVLSQPITAGDVVVINGSPRNVSNILMLIKARMRGAKTIWWGHHWSGTSKQYRYAIRIVIARLSDALLFYTDEEVTEYISKHNDNRLIFALNNGLNLAKITPVRKEFNAEERPRSIFFVGRLTKKSNLTALIAALSDRRLANVSLEVVGEGDMAEDCRRLADELGVGQNITWHGATLDEAKIADVANRCRLFVYPGSVGLSLIHAMAYGLPAVVSGNRKGHMPEIAAFTDGVTGRAYETTTPTLAETLAHVIDDVDALNRWSRESIRRVEERFNTTAMAQRFVSLVRQLEG
jgi:glycosyltransferase involved in cell wall biosynthesis